MTHPINQSMRDMARYYEIVTSLNTEKAGNMKFYQKSYRGKLIGETQQVTILGETHDSKLKVRFADSEVKFVAPGLLFDTPEEAQAAAVRRGNRKYAPICPGCGLPIEKGQGEEDAMGMVRHGWC